MFSDLTLEETIIEYRRSLHRIPELMFDLPETRKYLLSVLEPLGFEIRDLGECGFTVFIDAGKNDTVAFRCDMDALSVTEPEGCVFGSVHEGRMHACGHDGHMAILLGLAQKIFLYPDELSYNCLLVFQAAEEAGGGAKFVRDSGVLRDYGVSRIYGLHLWPRGPENTILCRPGEFMASMNLLEIEIEGRQTHIAEYKESLDTLEAGCIFVGRLYEFEKEIPSDVLRLLRLGKFVGGTTHNIIPGYTQLMGSIRTFDEKTYNEILSGIEKIMRDIEAEKGVRFSYRIIDGYPPVINHSGLYEQARSALTGAGFAWQVPEKPSLGGEDFSFYQKEIPGLYMFLGMGSDSVLHSPDYVMNEKALITGTNLMWTLLSGNG